MIKNTSTLGVAITVLALVFSAPATANIRVGGADLRVSFSDVVARVSPAVVNIYANKVVQTQTSPFAGDPFFQLFFGNQGIPGQVRSRVERSLGSGVIVRADGLMITNYHVIKGATDIRIIFHDRTEHTARLVNADPAADIAVMQLNLEPGETVPFIEFGDSDTLEVGDLVLAVGNPYGVGQSVSMGIVSALGRSNLGVSDAENFIQTDAAINPGNSGGALVDSNGLLMGINTAIYTKSGGHVGIGFATPANRVRNIVNSVITTGEVQRVWLGAFGQDLTADLAEQLGLKTPNGFLVNRIMDGSPAANAGLMVGDIILGVDGREVTGQRALNARLAEIPLGQRARLDVFRHGNKTSVPLVMQGLPSRRKEDQFVVTGNGHPFVGYTVEQLSPALASELGMNLEEQGVAIVALPNTLAGLTSTVGLRVGDIVMGINRQEIKTINDLRRALETQARAWEIVYKRGTRLFRFTVTG
jgi:serine protease Do